MYQLLRPLLFSLDPEWSHSAAMTALRALGELPGVIRPGSGPGDLGRPVDLMGLEFRNRVGLAAGFDKDGVAIEGFARLGFGFIEVGTVTPRPQPGNPRPRMFRIPDRGAVINRMGFNNLGVTALAARLQEVRRRDRLRGTLIGVNVGKNKDTPLEEAHGDYTACMDSVYVHADYLTLNLSSPNTPGLRSLQSGAALEQLLGTVVEHRARLAQQHGTHVPLLLKVAPDLEAEDVAEIAASVSRFGIEGLIATNTTISRPEVADLAVAAEAGGLSGTPLNPAAVATVAAFRATLPAHVPIVGVGGIAGPQQAQALLDAGASLLQLYTGFIYEGPGLVRRLLATGHAPGC